MNGKIITADHKITQRDGDNTVTKTAFITHRECLLHEMGAFHPECPARLSAINDYLIGQGLDGFFEHHQAPLALIRQLRKVHSADYIDDVRDSSPQTGIAHLDPDTAMNPHTWRAALRAAGAGVLAVDLVMDKEVQSAFCAVRPPGHHALRDAAMGFCFFNNIAVAAAHALEEHHLERVAIIDFDVHHGNGTENIFAGDERVLMCSIFQHPFYPYCGTDNPAPNMVNVPLARGAAGDEFRTAVENAWLPRLREFKPQMIFFSAGFDAHRDDDMGSLGLLEKDYAWCTAEMKKIADEFAQGRMVSMLEGGYILGSLSRSVAAHLQVLANLE